MEFQQLMKNDAKSALNSELNKLANSAPLDQQKVKISIFIETYRYTGLK